MPCDTCTDDAPRTVDLRIDAGWIIPVEPAGVLTGHALIVDGGRIVALLPAEPPTPRSRRAHASTCPTHVLIPGLVNAHTHAAMTLMRGVADDLPLKAWLEDHIWPLEARFVAPDFVHDGTLLGAAEMLRGGVTCCNDMYFYPDAAARAYETAGMRAMLGMPVLDFPTPYAADADAYLQRGLAARDAFKHSPLLTFSLAPHAPYTVGDATWDKIVMYARAARPADPDAPGRNAPRSRRGARRDRHDAARAARPAGRDRTGIHRDPRRAPRRQRTSTLLAAQRCHVVHCPGPT